MNWSYELDGVNVEIDGEQELDEAPGGEFGPEYQAVAAQIVEEERDAQNGPNAGFYDDREGTATSLGCGHGRSAQKVGVAPWPTGHQGRGKKGR